MDFSMTKHAQSVNAHVIQTHLTELCLRLWKAVQPYRISGLWAIHWQIKLSLFGTVCDTMLINVLI
jgi:hypothetical protein